MFIAFILIFLLFTFSAIAMAERPARHSSDLRQVISIDGNVERIDYVDQDGVIAFASDKHYATVIKTKSDNTVLEEYYDENGVPAKQTSGHYALLREYDDQGRNYKITYLGIDGQPITNSSGYSILFCDYSGEETAEHYLDTEGKPTASSSGIYGRRLIYENGRNTVIIYLDENGRPSRNKTGYAIIKRSFYEEGAAKDKVESEFYFDEYDTPVSLSLGQFGVHKEYDELGRNALLTYLNADGEPIVTKRGYTTVRRSFYPDNKVENEMYYDPDDRPVSLSHGQYGVKHVDGKIIYLDINGNEMFNLDNYLHTHPLSVYLISALIVAVSLFVGRKTNAILLLLYMAFVLYMTVMYRRDGETRAQFELFWSYKQFFTSPELRSEILNNIWLFVPFGTIVYRVSHKAWTFLLILLLSAAIETVQYFTGFGLAEFDDIISNGLGGLVGFGIGHVQIRSQEP